MRLSVRAPDEPKLYEYHVVECNNESRDSVDQHARHVHDDDDNGKYRERERERAFAHKNQPINTDHCCGGDSNSSCRDLHLLRWVGSERMLVDDILDWIESRDAPVLIIGFDGEVFFLILIPSMSSLCFE